MKKDAVFLKDSKTVLLLMGNWIKFFSISSEPSAIEILNVPCSFRINQGALGFRIHDSNLLIVYTNHLEYALISLEPLPKVNIRGEIRKDKSWIDIGFVNTLNDTIYFQYADGSVLVEEIRLK